MSRQIARFAGSVCIAWLLVKDLICHWVALFLWCSPSLQPEVVTTCLERLPVIHAFRALRIIASFDANAKAPS